MARIQSFKDLFVWQEAMHLTERCYHETEPFPRREHFGLASQLRKSAVSIASNIAEGQNRSSRAAYRNHIAIALGSQAELETQIELARRLSFINENGAGDLSDRAAHVGRLLRRLLNALDSDEGSERPAP